MMHDDDAEEISDGSCATPDDTDTESGDSDGSSDSDGHATPRGSHLDNRPPPRHPLTFLTIGTANVQHKGHTRTERGESVAECKKRNLHIMCIQEAQRPNVSEDHGSHIYRSGQRISQGVCLAFIIDKRFAQRVKILRKKSCPTRLILEISLCDNKFLVVNVHRPHKGYPADVRKEFDDDLIACVKSLKDPFTVMGDFNARVTNSVLRAAGVDIMSQFNPFLATQRDDGVISKLCVESKMKLLNFTFRPKDDEINVPQGATRKDPSGQFSCLDYMFICPTWSHLVTNVIRTSPLLTPSDHYPIVMTMRLPVRMRRNNSAPVTRAERSGPYNLLHTLNIVHKRNATKPQNNVALLPTPDRRIAEKRAEIKRITDSVHGPRSAKTKQQIDALRSELRKLVLRRETTIWTNVAARAQSAANAGNYDKVCQIVNEAVGKSTTLDAASSEDLHDAVTKVKTNLCTPPLAPDPAYDTRAPPPHATPMAEPTRRILKVYTDGSRLRHRRRRQAGCGVWVPELNLRFTCRVPLAMDQTSAAAEVCAVLLALKKLAHIPADWSIEIVSDCAYVVHYVNHKLECLQQQDFSDCAHSALWREIVRELITTPHYASATWIRAHTASMSPEHVANRVVDILAKQAARDICTDNPPWLDPTHITHSQVRSGPPTNLELDAAINDLNATSPGIDGIVTAVYKLPEARPAIDALVAHTWAHSKIPEELVDALMAFVPKKDGSPRPLCMINGMVKIIMNVLRRRFKVIPVLHAQFGFQRARDTTMAIHLLRHRIRAIHRKGKAVYLVFIDSLAAYDKLDRSKVWAALRSRGVPENVINIIRSAYDGDIHVKEDRSIVFQATSGVKQGDPLSPDIFNIALDCVIHDSSLMDDLECIIAYADDIVLIGDDMAILQRHLTDLEVKAGAYGLSFNLGKGKTEAMCITPLMQQRRRGAHVAAQASNLGAFADPSSETARTFNGSTWFVRDNASHLYCPECAYMQRDRSDPNHALKNFKDHCRSDHPTWTVKHFPHNTVPLPFAPAPRDALPLWAIPPHQFITLNGALPWVDAYKYLGSWISSTGTCSLAVAERLVSARGSLFSLASLLHNKALDTHTRVWLYETIVAPCLLYGLEAAVLDSDDMEILEKFQSKALRKIMNLYHYPGVWGQQVWYSYECVLFWAQTPSIHDGLRLRRLRLGGRMLRAATGHPSKEALADLANAIANPSLTTDEWTRSLAHDMADVNLDIKVLENRYQLQLRLHTANPHVQHR